MGLLLASRQSDLARLQAYQVGQALVDQGLSVDYHFRQSLGDINQSDPLWKMPEKGVFTEDFRKGLEEGHWDMVIHSWKDLPIEEMEKTAIVATLPRADARDVLVFKKDHFQKKQKTPQLRLYSSSPRRIYNLAPFLKEFFPLPLQSVEFESVRGNILTRVRKLMESEEVDGLIVAKAALDRLLKVEGDEFVEGQKELKKHLNQCLFQVLPLSLNPTAAAQGALAIEIRKDREDLKKVLSKIHCEATWQAAGQERQVLKSYGGGCHQKIGVSCYVGTWGQVEFLRGETEEGQPLERVSFSKKYSPLQQPSQQKLSVFKRLPREFVKDSSYTGHFVSRSSSVPDSIDFAIDEVVWASGLQTWKKLAQRGIWVSGCSDSLGEESVDQLGPLFAGRKWYKWSHSRAPQSKDKTLLPTYDLQSKPLQESFEGIQEFFWMSGTQFEEVIRQKPELLKARHFCGPGHTFQHIQKILQEKNSQSEVSILPSYQFWQKQVKEWKHEHDV